MIACRHEADILYAGIFELLNGFDNIDDCAAGADADVPGFRIEVLFHCKVGGGAFGGLDSGELGGGGGGHGGKRDGGDGLWEVHCVGEKLGFRA